MKKNEKSTGEKDNSKNNGILAEMNESSASNDKESKTGNAEDMGVLGKINGEAKKK